jgi:hypothetical protein
MDHNQDATSVKRKLAVLSMTACVTLSGVLAVPGCGVMAGMERAEDAKQTKRQVEKQGEELEKKLQEGQEDPEGQ